MGNRIKVVIAGINGRMGRASAKAILEDPELELVGAFGRRNAAYVGSDVGNLTGSAATGILVSNELKDLPARVKPDVLLDFTLAEAAVNTAQAAMNMGIRPVIGASGLSEAEIAFLAKVAGEQETGCLVVPNFSIGAVLMMEFAKQAGKYFSNIEIVEMHHTRKIDAPSGTAMHTVAKLAEVGSKYNPKEVEERELIPSARGAETPSGIRVHSLRLPGLISHQEVICGAAGEMLTIRHDSFNTECFSKGIKLAVKAVMQLKTCLVGLDKVMN